MIKDVNGSRKMKTELFVNGDGSAHVFYGRFIRKNQDIEIISVNVLNTGSILLTYYDKK